MTSVPGTYGSILDTMRHIVGADASYLFVATGGRTAPIDEETMDLQQRTVMEGHGPEWSRLLAQDLDPDTVLVRHRTTGPRPTRRWASGSRRWCTMEPIIGARSART